MADNDHQEGNEETKGDIAEVRREAAKHRTKAREAEDRADKLAERLAVSHKREATQLAAKHLADGADLFRDGEVDLAGLLDDDGDLDPQKVTDAAEGVVERQPHWQRRETTAAGGADGNKGVAPVHEDEAPSFGAALKAA